MFTAAATADDDDGDDDEDDDEDDDDNDNVKIDNVAAAAFNNSKYDNSIDLMMMMMMMMMVMMKMMIMSVFIGILPRSTDLYNRDMQRQLRLVLEWVTILVCQFLWIVLQMRLSTEVPWCYFCFDSMNPF